MMNIKSGKDALNVFLYPKVIETMLKDAKESRPNEASGILCGTFLPTLGIVVIKKAYPCKRAHKTPTYVQCTEEDLFDIDRIRKKDKVGEFYGWYHSHPIGHRLSGINSESQSKMQKIYGTYLGAVIGFDYKEVRFFIMKGSYDLTVPYKKFENEEDLVFEILHRITDFYFQIANEMKRTIEKPIEVKLPMLMEEIENLLQRTVDLEDDILELKNISDDLAEKVRTHHLQITDLKRDIEALLKTGIGMG